MQKFLRMPEIINCATSAANTINLKLCFKSVIKVDFNTTKKYGQIMSPPTVIN